MKKLLTILICSLILFSLTACENNKAEQGGATPETSVPSGTATPEISAPSETTTPILSVQENDDEALTDSKDSKVLVAYFSRVGNTDFDADVDAVTSATLNVRDGELTGNNKIIADMIVELTGGDLFLIQTEKTYPSNYRQTTDVAKDEQKSNARPGLSSHVENMDDYDIIILCYPNWWGTLPQALYTFLEEYDFTGKTIAPLCTHEGSGLGGSVSDIIKLCPDATILDGLAIRGANVNNAHNDVEKWLRDLGIIE